MLENLLEKIELHLPSTHYFLSVAFNEDISTHYICNIKTQHNICDVNFFFEYLCII
jgi:hypothetical protein